MSNRTITPTQNKGRHFSLLEMLRSPALLHDLRRWLHRLKWVIPAGLIFLVVFYEYGSSRWVYQRFGFGSHVLLDLIIFGTVGPALAYVWLAYLERWLEERETSELQAQILQQARRDAHRSRQLTDDAVQVLFSASTLLETMKAEHENWSSETIKQFSVTEKAMDKLVRELRSHLLD